MIVEAEADGATFIYRRNLAMRSILPDKLMFGGYWYLLVTNSYAPRRGWSDAFLGGTPGYILRMLMGEGAVLTFVAVLVGCLLYLQYALKEGLANGENWRASTEEYWVTDFTQHFLIVSFIVFLLCW